MTILKRMQQNEKASRIAIMVASLMGGAVFIQYGILRVSFIHDPFIFGLLTLFLFIVEFYPMPIWRGFTSISFPLVYAIFVMQGLEFVVVTYAVVVLVINVIKRRPLRIVFFNPAQLIISFVLAYYLGSSFYTLLPVNHLSPIIQGMIHIAFMMTPFYLINNTIVDFILTIRPQPYTYKIWRQKSYQELNSFLVSFVYLTLFYILGNQNRGEIDAVAFFFFFSPLVAVALLFSIITRLRKEKFRLKALFNISTELNKKIPTEDWIEVLNKQLPNFIEVDASSLWIKENDFFRLKFSTGILIDQVERVEAAQSDLNYIRKLTIYHDRKKEGGPAAYLFDEEVRTFLYAPLMMDEEVVGLFIFGRSRTKSFSEEDLQSAATIANQLAVILKTKQLIAEQEKAVILEERNRIARDIHDGVAQSLAGAVMKLETAERKFYKMPDESLHLIQDSREKLRISLKEVRESIYQLRPYPTERVGLIAAITSRIQSLTLEHSLNIQLETRGGEYPLSSMVEKIIFDTFQESIQNAIKHAKASKIEILLSYQKEHMLLRVKDNGVGFSLFQAMIKARNQPHFGILHMNEAAENIHASLQIDSKEGEGTEITLTVPKMGIEGGMVNDQAYASR
ncbi:GAF domain-containing sensor histidine kinase [Robertmurraya korlensis]|uniref:GAF domain-containing sensor histidine kinase n=1 Tax=Robertmurraya korlensis TaxID=519977 RepID=UPI0008258569|nr:sensor histidine kinase [Robertmurraya korlensis]